ncbi:MAG: methyltransferase regulatory domain-containing protein [Nitrosomonas sp.]|uniref:class I SAM-dependent methyltransferase n=1 Tax=Nitrosomonas sp. TaxID=42353 RepID=UPI0025DC2EF2|nr:class I SAM-dependent methyltransferase [Nitrosomonas sp.]UJP02483.1 MAG: methyltransferase regulatory domain-containing protein [Nitrosomonas sp.]
MNDWTSGYVADINYIYGYYSELSPLRVKLALTNAGFRSPEIGMACELGFGQGISVNLHAAGSTAAWYGTDFNPAQAGFAQELAQASGSGARLYDQAFEEFCSRNDLPDFDYIGLHGIWSWISDDNRRVIVDFARRKLKVGGVLYISYNTFPGWASFVPMRHLLTTHGEVIGAEGHGIVNRINEAINFAEKLLAVNPGYARANPQLAERMKHIKGQNRHYLAHEYFNRDWHPVHFATMTEWLAAAKLNFACSVHLLDHINVLNLSNEQQEFLNNIPDAMLRESVRDFIVNQQFRRDYWIKGGRRISSIEQIELTRTIKVIMMVQRVDALMEVTGTLGKATLNEAVYEPILDLLSDHKIKSVSQIEEALRNRGITLTQIMQAVMILVSTGQIALVQEENAVSKARKQTDKLNQYLLKKAFSSEEINFLVSPVTGGGIAVGRFQQLFVLAMSKGKVNINDCVQFAWQVIVAQGQKIIKDEKVLQSEQENLEELTKLARTFFEKQIPVLKALQIL